MANGYTASVIVSIDSPRAGSARDLRLGLGLDEQPALAVIDLADVPGVTVQLRLLAAGHQVMFDVPGGRVTETVAWLPEGQDVSEAVEREVAGCQFRFQGEVTDSARKVRDLARLYAAAWEDRPHVLRGLFPGDPEAIGEIQVELRGFPKNVRWTTVHTYPAVGQVLMTKSSVTIPDSVPH